jgi:four helix bundle protein
MMPYERFRAWQAAHGLAVAVYRTTRRWPTEERYGLTGQVRRAAFSIPANLAGGSARRGPAELRRFLDIALGSHAELAYALRLARDLEYLSAEEHRELAAKHQTAGRLLRGLYNSVRPSH